MITCTLEKPGVTVSRLGFGLMRLPQTPDGKIDRATAGRMVDRAMAAGVNYYDTAYGYHGGESELFVKEALAGKYPRESYMLASKLPSWLVKTPEDVERLLDEQLAKCGVDYFDVYHMHALDKERWAVMQDVKAFEILSRKKAEGKIRHIGFSYHGDFDTFSKAVDAADWDFVQIQINYVDYTMMDAKAFHDKLTEKGVACIVMEPVRGGFLASLPERAATILNEVNGDSFAKWALRWCIDQENMPVILSGMTSMEQLEENLATFAAPSSLTSEEKNALERASSAIQDIKTVPCTACNYCMPCPFGVAIPDVFRVYNQYKLFNNAFRTGKNYEDLGAEHQASACTSCGACLSKCPQSIQIPDSLAEAGSVIMAL